MVVVRPPAEQCQNRYNPAGKGIALQDPKGNVFCKMNQLHGRKRLFPTADLNHVHERLFTFTSFGGFQPCCCNGFGYRFGFTFLKADLEMTVARLTSAILVKHHVWPKMYDFGVLILA